MSLSCLNAQPPQNRDLDENIASISHNILFSDAEGDLPTSDSEDDHNDDNE